MHLTTAVAPQAVGHVPATYMPPGARPITVVAPGPREASGRVAVVHHNAAWAFRLAGLLRRPPEGARVQIFTDARIALGELLHDPPAVVLTALDMPFIDGADLIRRLHSHCVDATTILLADLSVLQEQALSTGAVSVPATIDPAELARVVKDAMFRFSGWDRRSTDPVPRHRPSPA